ncbi:mechanosensitive ion channel family protein, partial [Gammaproteobacteria bacterium]|nr:mechanosensitive ion channel family protein [Gammaproteobacteria bacterium]
ILCYSNPVSFTDFSKIKQNLIFEIIKIVRSNGSEFAFPSRSIYIENSEDLDPSKYLAKGLSEKISNKSNPQQGED